MARAYGERVKMCLSLSSNAAAGLVLLANSEDIDEVREVWTRWKEYAAEFAKGDVS